MHINPYNMHICINVIRIKGGHMPKGPEPGGGHRGSRVTPVVWGCFTALKPLKKTAAAGGRRDLSALTPEDNPCAPFAIRRVLALAPSFKLTN